jgi:hypothetical protein
MVTERWTSLKGLEQCWVLKLDMKLKHILAGLALRCADTFGFFGCDDDFSFVLQQRKVISGANVRKCSTLCHKWKGHTRPKQQKRANHDSLVNY